MFIVFTKNFIASQIAVKATKAAADSEETKVIYKKAVIGSKTGKIFLKDLAELTLWGLALLNYKAASETEAKVLEALQLSAAKAIEAAKAEVATPVEVAAN